ncbi:phage infection protein [Lysobacter sp. A3-1-A15]|uniref:phage infection protein n=1 Tax=Novilysobacter viscosus TaxID=3098602 RepID=UPI002EDAC8B6
MNVLTIDLENCYGIRKLEASLDFSRTKAIAIYAPNGSMKSSLAQTFHDIASDQPSRDRIFASRVTKRIVKDETGVDISRESVLVIRPYDETVGHSARTSTLLVNPELRHEYEELHAEIESAKAEFLAAVRDRSKTKRDVSKEISMVFTAAPDKLYVALNRIKDEVADGPESMLRDVPYDLIFDEKVLGFLETKDFRTAIDDFIKKHNELLAASTYFKKGVFNYYNATQVAKQLADNGFFKAQHSINLNASETIEITTQEQLERLIAAEKDAISNDQELRKKFAEIEKLIQKNVTVREFEAYLLDHEELLTKFANMADFRQEVWKAYIDTCHAEYKALLDKYQAAETRRKEIEQQAQRERTQWEDVIDIFNSRFFVPFRLKVSNRMDVILGLEEMLSLGFVFDDGTEQAPVDRASLLQSLSTGEKKALYVLNVLFEIEARKKAGQDTLMVVDDIADSFDYKNKYAIIQYLMDIAQGPHFKQILLTHNFDFYRTVESRFVGYPNCRMVAKTSAGVELMPAEGVKNVFIRDWKEAFFSSSLKMLACISFMRNLIEYTRGESDHEFLKLTSLLHWKADSGTILVSDLDAIYNGLFGTNGTSANPSQGVVALIEEEAAHCLSAPEGINFPNKVVLAIATRLTAERFMASRINDQEFLEGIMSNQTGTLVRKFQELFPSERATLSILQRVALMTPENIHLNSFMYEPILDMSDGHLRRLFTDVRELH